MAAKGLLAVPPQAHGDSDSDGDDDRLNVSFASSGKSWSEFDFREFYGASILADSAPRRGSAGTAALTAAGESRRASWPTPRPEADAPPAATVSPSNPRSSPFAASLKSKLVMPSARSSSGPIPVPQSPTAHSPRSGSVGSMGGYAAGAAGSPGAGGLGAAAGGMRASRSFARSSVARISTTRSAREVSSGESPRVEAAALPPVADDALDDFYLSEAAEHTAADEEDEEDLAMRSLYFWSDIKRAVRIDLPAVGCAALGMTLSSLVGSSTGSASGGVYVSRVVPGGLADVEGVSVGDRVLSVNGEFCDHLTPDAVSALVDASRDAVSVVFVKLITSAAATDPSRVINAWISGGSRASSRASNASTAAVVGSAPAPPSPAVEQAGAAVDESRTKRASTWDGVSSTAGSVRLAPHEVDSNSRPNGSPRARTRAVSEVGSLRRRPHGDMDDETGIWDEPLVNGVNILFDAQNEVRGGTLNALVTYLTSEHDPAFLSVFLLMHRSFCSSEDLVKRLIQRFWGPPEGSPAASLPEVTDPDACRNRRARVTNALKKLIDGDAFDLPDSVVLAVRAFLKHLLDAKAPTPKPLVLSLYRRTSTRASIDAKNVRLSRGGEAESPEEPLPSVDELSVAPGMVHLGKDPRGRPILVPRGTPPSDPRALLSLSSKAIARQLTAVDHAIYRAISPIELQDQSWSKAERRHGSPNVLAFIRRFNFVSSLVASSILLADKKPQGRGAAMDKWIKIASYLHTLNSFNALTAVVAALGNSAIARLKASKQWVSKERMDDLARFQTLLAPSGSYRAYRTYLHSINPPCVPYLGVYLTDLTFIGDGNPSEISPGIVNMTKRRMEHRVIFEVRQYQQDAYSDVPFDAAVIGAIDGFPVLTDDKEMFSLSLELEPRGAPLDAPPSELQKKLARGKAGVFALKKKGSQWPRGSDASPD